MVTAERTSKTMNYRITLNGTILAHGYVSATHGVRVAWTDGSTGPSVDDWGKLHKAVLLLYNSSQKSEDAEIIAVTGSVVYRIERISEKATFAWEILLHQRDGTVAERFRLARGTRERAFDLGERLLQNAQKYRLTAREPVLVAFTPTIIERLS